MGRYFYTLLLRRAEAASLPPWDQSVFTVALVKREPVMWSCQPPTEAVNYNQCRLCWREKEPCAQVCAYCMSQRLASLIKAAWAAQVLVIVVCLLRNLRVDMLMKADCTVHYTQLHCWLLLVLSHSNNHLKSALFSCLLSFLICFLPQMLLYLSYLWVSRLGSCQLWPLWKCIYVLLKFLNHIYSRSFWSAIVIFLYVWEEWYTEKKYLKGS